MPPPPLAPERQPIVRLGQTLSYGDLKDEVAQAVRADARSHREIAEAMGLESVGSFSNALYNAGPRYAKLQVRILRFLSTSYDFEDVGGYKVVRRGTDGEAAS